MKIETLRKKVIENKISCPICKKEIFGYDKTSLTCNQHGYETFKVDYGCCGIFFTIESKSEKQ